MLKYFFLSLIFLGLSYAGFGQASLTVETGPQPQGGSNAVALNYYKIDFTKAQRQLLAGQELELIFNIDKTGIPTLEKVNGINEPAIVDSLFRRTQKLLAFTPGKQNGVAVNTVYFIKFSFPTYTRFPQQVYYPDAFGYKQYKLDDFEYVNKSGKRWDMAFGGIFNGFEGNAGNYLGVGGGMKLDMIYTGKTGYGAGLLMNFYGNKLKTPYPINSTREQHSAPPTLLIGTSFNKYLLQKDGSEINIQLDLCYAIQNITERLDEADKGWTQFQGFSPGVALNYLIKVGQDKPNHYYGNPTLFSNYINVHGAVRPLFFDLKEASGIMLELGISYRFARHEIGDYKIKPEAQK